MNSDNVFRTREEELARLNSELAEIRGLLRDATSRLGQIERHVKRAFGIKETPRQPPPNPKQAGSEKPSISPEEALEEFRELTDLSREKGSTTVEQRLEQMSIADLKLMARELGVSFSSKPSRKNLHGGIRGRISESLMLSPTRHAAAPDADRDAGSEEAGSEEAGTEEKGKTQHSPTDSDPKAE